MAWLAIERDSRLYHQRGMRMRTSRLPAILVLVVLFLLTGTTVPARAGFIYSNFGPGDSFNTGLGAGLSDNSGARIEQAAAFTVPTGQDYVLRSIELAVFTYGVPHNELDVTLAANDNGQPGSAIESFRLIDQMSLAPSIVSADSSLHPILQGGTQYWVTALVPEGSPGGGWDFDTVGAVNPGAERFFDASGNPGAWSTFTGYPTGAFRVDGDPAVVPEPSTLVLAAVGMLGFVGYGWRRHKRG